MTGKAREPQNKVSGGLYPESGEVEHSQNEGGLAIPQSLVRNETMTKNLSVRGTLRREYKLALLRKLLLGKIQ